jgi:hypothetical protein
MHITARQAQLLTAIQAHDGAIDRHALATATGKKYLSQHDVKLLERLEEHGYITIGHEQRGITMAHVYTATDKTTETA